VLENALDEFEGTVFVISHDRYFLDRVVDRIVELDQGRLTAYPGNYSYYREARARRDQAAA
jgi:macrolide transport system ATP-binding/permease protein